MNIDVRDTLVGSRDLFSLSEIYHENSKIASDAPGMYQSAESSQVAADGFKRYSHASFHTLPSPVNELHASLGNVIRERRSIRCYTSDVLELNTLSSLIHHTFGLVSGTPRRRVPSAGALGPLELYIVARRVEKLEVGTYHYNVRQHGLCQIATGDTSVGLAKAVFIAEAVETCAVVAILTGVFGRSKIKYGERAYRFALLEAGHVMQNLCLTATALGLGACPIGGFVDDDLNELLGIDGVDEAVLYTATVGDIENTKVVCSETSVDR